MITWYNRFRDWLFGTPTQILETINIMYLLGWSVALIDKRLLAKPIYAGALPNNAFEFSQYGAVFFIVAAIFASIGVRKRDPHHDRVSGYALQLSSFLWFVISINFMASYPPLNTGVITYFIFALFCWLTGYELLRRNKREGKDD